MQTHPLLARRLGLTRATLDALCGTCALRYIAGDFKLGSSGSVLQVKRVELFTNARQDNSPLQTLVIATSLLLGSATLLLLGLLGPDNALFSQRRLEAFQLRSRHFGVDWLVEAACHSSAPSAGSNFWWCLEIF